MSESIRLLYAEDNPQDADLLRAHFGLLASEFKISIVDSGEACLESFAGSQYDLLLLDNHLPDMEGTDLLAILRANGNNVPVVMVTGIGDDETVGRALRAGASDYVAKTGDYLATLPAILNGVLKRLRSSQLLGGNGIRIMQHILYVEPNPMDVELAQSYFAAEEPLMQLHPVSTCHEALLLLEQRHEFNLVLTDLRLPGMDAQEFLHQALHRGIMLPFIIITGRGDETSAVNILRLGAYDYILKREGYLAQLPHSIRHALQRFNLDQLNQSLRCELLALNATLEQQVAQRTAELRHEIEERKLVEIALLESENRHRRLFEGSGDALILFRDGRYIDCNDAALKLFGYSSKQEFINADISERSPAFQPDGCASVEKTREIGNAVMREGSIRFEWQYRRVNGPDFLGEVTLTVIEISGEKILYGLVRDISERARAELLIQRLGQFYRMLSQINEAIVRIRTRDELFTRICNIVVKSDLCCMAWVGKLDKQRVVSLAYAGAAEGYVNYLDIKLDDICRSNGPSATALRTNAHVICQNIETDPRMAPWREAALQHGFRSSASFPISLENEVFGIINVYSTEKNFFNQDIVDLMLELASDVSFSLDVMAVRERRERAEHEIRQLNAALELRVAERTAQLELANRELEAFSYSVSHDLRAPLRSIDGFSQLLENDYASQLDETARDYLSRVSAASQRMGCLIDDLLQLSRVSLAQIGREPVDLSEVVTEIAAQLHNNDPGRKVRFTIQPGLNACADPGLLRVALMNLLENAYKFTGKNAVAEIEFGMSADEQGENFYFIRDNGVGFDMKYADQLFAAFKRLHSANDFAGSGIGLATVQRIIQRHQCRIWANSKKGEGAMFCFNLPQLT